MDTFLTPDKTVIIDGFADGVLTICQKIMPDGTIAEKYVAPHVKKGQLMKPQKKLNDGTGKPLGETIHNTEMIKAANGTNPAEQYARSTYNGNMSGIIVTFYVWGKIIWQLLGEDERGWHAGDGSSRKKGQRADSSLIGGNIDTISIEAIGDDPETEKTTAKLAAYLLKKHGLSPETDVYPHKYWNGKQCPIYILPHWDSFIGTIKKYYTEICRSDTAADKPVANTDEAEKDKEAPAQKVPFTVKLAEGTIIYDIAPKQERAIDKTGVYTIVGTVKVGGVDYGRLKAGGYIIL
jgi:N-acetylmuramoyl-L-alanine amidase CwlA